MLYRSVVGTFLCAEMCFFLNSFVLNLLFDLWLLDISDNIENRIENLAFQFEFNSFIL